MPDRSYPKVFRFERKNEEKQSNQTLSTSKVLFLIGGQIFRLQDSEEAP